MVCLSLTICLPRSRIFVKDIVMFEVPHEPTSPCKPSILLRRKVLKVVREVWVAVVMHKKSILHQIRLVIRWTNFLYLIDFLLCEKSWPVRGKLSAIALVSQWSDFVGVSPVRDA